jgi:hypothetical protein
MNSSLTAKTVLFFVCLFFETGSHYAAQAGLELMEVLGLQICTTTPSSKIF